MLPETMAIRAALIAGLVVATAGLDQVSPLKHTCLRRCRASGRSPAEGQWPSDA